RRFFAFFNAGVLDLRRVRYGFVNLNALPVGKARFLNRQEYNELHAFMANRANVKED
ncbi:pseudouridine synthase, partial [Helicobacter pylori]